MNINSFSCSDLIGNVTTQDHCVPGPFASDTLVDNCNESLGRSQLELEFVFHGLPGFPSRLSEMASDGLEQKHDVSK